MRGPVALRCGHAADCACFSRSLLLALASPHADALEVERQPVSLELGDVRIARHPGEVPPQINRSIIVRDVADDGPEHLRSIAAVEDDRRHAERLVHGDGLVVLALHRIPRRRVGKRLLEQSRAPDLPRAAMPRSPHGRRAGVRADDARRSAPCRTRPRRRCRARCAPRWRCGATARTRCPQPHAPRRHC